MTEFRTRTDGTRYPVHGVYTDYTKYDTYTHPMRCKLCGQYVFFYQSENGGKVVFDDLGPSWPKHSHQGDVEKGVALPQDPGWKQSGFEPLIIAGKLAPNTGLWDASIMGGQGAFSKKRLLWIPKSSRLNLYNVLLQKNHPVFCKRIRDTWVYEIHFLTKDGSSFKGREVQGLLIPDQHCAGIRKNRHNNKLDKELNNQLSQRRSSEHIIQILKDAGFYQPVMQEKPKYRRKKAKSKPKHSKKSIDRAVGLFR